MLTKDLLVKAGRKPLGITRIVMLDTVWDYTLRGDQIAVNLPLLEKSFGLTRDGLTDGDQKAIRQALATQAVKLGYITIGGTKQ